MYLDKHQVQQIESDVEGARITLTHLSHELVDHICCEVELLMTQGKTFEDAYNIVKEQTGMKVLQKIQENTLYLIDKKYALMKTTMKITGNVSLALIAIGTVMKIYHWAGWPITLMLGFVLLCFVFFPAAVYLNYSYKTDRKKPLLNISILLGGIIFMVGILFKVMHWPGSFNLLFAGWSIILLIFLPLLLFVKMKEADTAKEKGIYILGIIALIVFEFSTMFKMFHWNGGGILMLWGSFLLIVLFLPMFTSMKIRKNQMSIGQFIFTITLSMFALVLTFLLNMNVSTPVLECFTNEEYCNAQISKYFEAKHEQQIAAAKNGKGGLNKPSENQLAVSQSADKLQKLISDLKISLVMVTNQVDKNTALQLLDTTEWMNMKANYDCVNLFLLQPEGNKTLNPLKTELTHFKKLSAIATPALSDNIENLLDTSDKNINGETKNWEESNFRDRPLINTISRLTEMQNTVRMVESVINK